MDTKLKKSHKRTKLIIALIILLPALLLVCLYPRMEKAMLNKREQRIAEYEQEKAEYEARRAEKEAASVEISEAADASEKAGETEESAAALAEDAPEKEIAYYLEQNFVNYAIEAGYYQYALLLQEATGEEAATDILEYYGWVNDYYEITTSTPYYAEYTHEEEETESETTGSASTENPVPESVFTAQENLELTEEEARTLLSSESLDPEREKELKEAGLLGYLTIEYDRFGRLSNIRLHGEDNLNYEDSVYERARKSIEQFQTNAEYYKETTGNSADEAGGRLSPESFRTLWLIYADNERFLGNSEMPYDDTAVDVYYTEEPYFGPEDLYLSTGAYWIVLAMGIFVALAALILPCFKKLETGWERLFCLPTEIIALLIFCGFPAAMGMCILMCHSTMDTITNEFLAAGNAIELLGYTFSAKQCYYGLLVLNFLGWAACFFIEYICVAQVRQFFCGPVYYVKHRFLIVKFCRWIVRQCKKLIQYITDIDLQENMHKSIIKIVLANLVVVTVLCCFWFAGIFGVLIYSALLYILLCRYGEKLQKQYRSILNATGQMAEGDLKISLDEDLGVFAPLGTELEKVQQGFSKAVAEEAKSQNMRSELITNVSHDLKTPLTAIITYVDLLKNPDITEEERQSYIQTLDMKSQRLKVLIEDLFEVSKANSGNVKMNFMDVDIVNLMKEVRLELEDKLAQSDLTFRWNLPEEKVLLWLDGQRTYRIFENLLNNAMKYAMPGTRVYVDILNKESEVEIIFKNMSAQELTFEAEHLTERFVRGDSARNSEGSGLGLAIAKSFTELQHGEFFISVDGDLFKVTIRFFKK